jgi:macrolide-specific efflux system membrane fusion protein
MYYVDIIPEQIPSVFRSGMSATITIIVKQKPNALLVPLEAVQQRNGQSVVLQRNNASSSSAKVRYCAVQTGLRNEQMVEIVAGLGEQDAVLLPDTAFALPSKKGGTNPFRPQRSPNRP